LGTVTTNFVNIYMSSLAWKSLAPRAHDGAVVWSIGLIGTALSALPGVWLEQYTNFMVVLGGLLVPVGGVLAAHYYLTDARADDSLTAALYDSEGPFGGVSAAGLTAWVAGAAVDFRANRGSGGGGDLPGRLTGVGGGVVAGGGGEDPSPASRRPPARHPGEGLGRRARPRRQPARGYGGHDGERDRDGERGRIAGRHAVKQARERAADRERAAGAD